MSRKKNYTKEQILTAMDHTKSNLAASRYLGCSYQHYKKWAKLYKSNKKGFVTLFDEHLNQRGKGIPKHFGGKTPSKNVPLLDILEGRLDPSSFEPGVIKNRLISDGYVKEECDICEFNERRVLDYRMPLLMNFIDGNKQNYLKENLRMLCYNCFFLQVGNIFTNKQIKGIEDHKPVNLGGVDWDVDEYHKEKLISLGLGDKRNEDEYNIVAYK